MCLIAVFIFAVSVSASIWEGAIMAEQSLNYGCFKDLTIEELREFSNIFATEFNRSEMHDRVLCFQIIENDMHDSKDEESEKRGTETSEEGNACSVTN